MTSKRCVIAFWALNRANLDIKEKGIAFWVMNRANLDVKEMEEKLVQCPIRDSSPQAA